MKRSNNANIIKVVLLKFKVNNIYVTILLELGKTNQITSYNKTLNLCHLIHHTYNTNMNLVLNLFI